MLYILIIAAIVIVDQLTKIAVVANFALGDSVPILGFIHFTYVRNTGAAFSILPDSTWFFIVMTFIVLGVLLVLWRRDFVRPYRLSLAIIIGGAIGNLIDRIVRGFVVDFIDFGWFPVFNIADTAVVCGVILFCIQILFFGKKEEQKDTEAKP